MHQAHHEQRPVQLLDRQGETGTRLAAARYRRVGHHHQSGLLLHAGAPRRERTPAPAHAGHTVSSRYAVGGYGRRQCASISRLHDVGVPIAARVARPLRIRSINPFELPETQTATCRATTIAALPSRPSRPIARSLVHLRAPLREARVKPGPAAVNDPRMLEFCRDHGAITLHPSGTCRMGGQAPAVVGAPVRLCACTALPACASSTPGHCRPWSREAPAHRRS